MPYKPASKHQVLIIKYQAYGGTFRGIFDYSS